MEIAALIVAGIKILVEGAMAISENARREGRPLTQEEQDAISSGNTSEIQRFMRLIK